MKKLPFILLIAAQVLFTLHSCRPKDIPLEVEQAEPKLVVSSQYLPQFGMVIWITKSFSALENKNAEGPGAFGTENLDDIMVSEANVTLTSVTGKSTRLMAMGQGIYVMVQGPEFFEGKLTLNVYDPASGLSAKAETQPMASVNIRDLSARRKAANGIESIDVDYSIEDPAGKNYYLISFYGQPSDTAEPFVPQGFQLQNIHSKIFTDEEGSSGTIELTGWTYDTIGVALSNVSKEYYEFLFSMQRASNGIPFLSEPVAVRGNVEGGYGFFSAHFPDLKVIDKIE